jgi:hypothetical protein
VTESSADARHLHRFVQLGWIAIGLYLVGLGISAVLRTQGDFNVYYRAGARVLNGEAIYRLDESSHFLYAPIFAILFAPFAMLPLRAAQFAWYLVSAASLIAFIFGSARMLLGRDRLNASMLVIPVALSAVFIDNNIEHGQINLPTLALIVWSIVFAEEDRAIVGGAALAVAILIKPFAGLAALFLLLERKWRPLLYSIGVGIILLVAPVMVFGRSGTVANTSAYLRVVSSMTDRYTTMLTNQSATSAVARLMSLGAPADLSSSHLPLYIGTAVELVLVVAIVVWFLADRDFDPGRFPEPHRFQLAALFCIMPSLVPISWKSYYAALLVPYMLLTVVLWPDRPSGSSPSALTLALVALSVILNWIPGRRANHLAMFFSVHLVSSMLLLAAVVTAAVWAANSAQCRLTKAGTVDN